ncbi:unnamed protein product [Pelagomonas calceolata]|uniref:Uncharacterized protein n=1 Tax=Pelagomonas calceolata TaxID=35677 RepID=A0A8J2S7T9_9STRA|nr:unnamed protein product [Pelagomonas calceolata]
MRTALALLSLASAARALSAYHSQRTHSKEAASYRAQASQLRKEAAILETELIKERKALEALRELENPKPADTTPPQPVLVAKAGAVEVRWALDDAGALKAKVAAGGATLDLEGSWRASDRTVLLAASGVLGVRVACEAPMMAAEGVRAARERRRTCERALARAEQAAPEAAAALYALDGVDAPSGGWVRRRLAAARRRRRARRVARLAARTIAGARADAQRWDAAVRPFDGPAITVTLDGVDRVVGASGAIECVGLRAAVYGRKRDRRPLFARCSLSRDVPRRRVARARSGGRAGGGAKLST